MNASTYPGHGSADWRAHVGAALGLLVSGTFGWFAVCSAELRDLKFGLGYGWIAALHLLRVAFWFTLGGTAALLTLRALRAVLLTRTRHGEWIAVVLLAAVCAPFAWETADALLSGGMFGESEGARMFVGPLALLLCGVYVAPWFAHLVLCRAPRFAWPGWLAAAVARLPASLRFAIVWLVGAAALVLLVDAIDRQLRAYLFVARYLLPAAWLLAVTLIASLAARLPMGARVALGVLGAAVVVAAFVLEPPARGLAKVRNDIARLAGAASLSDVSAQKQRDAQLAALDFSRPERFDCEASVRERAAPPRSASQRNVILISVDALRRDAVESSLGDVPLMPKLAAFADKSVSFERAVTTYPATLFAVGAALTGLGPSEVLFAPDVPPNVFTQAKGAVDVRHIFLPESYWFRKTIVRRLFQQTTPTAFGKDDVKSVDRMIDALESAREQNQRLFAWLHLFEPHIRADEGETPESRQHDYRRQISSTDKQLGRVFRMLDKLDYYQDSLVIFFSDHGEALGELGFVGHHVYLNHFLTDIPLFVRVPGAEPRRDLRTTTIADVAPTILEWLGLPMRRTDARSLLAPAPEHDNRFVVSEAFPLRGSALFDLARTRISSVRALEKRVAAVRKSSLDYSPKVAVTTARYRLIVDRDSGAEQLYDRTLDPEEKQNLADQGLPVHAQLKRELAAWAVRQSESIYCAVAKAK